MSRLTKEQDELIISLYNAGKSYREVRDITGFSLATICARVRGIRTPREGGALARAAGKGKLTDRGRAALSENGRRACQRSGKYYTKPERMFKQLLNEIGVGVKFPQYIREIKNVEDDVYAHCLLYQYPVQRYVIDFVDAENKIAININGDYWHANPILYDKTTLGKLQQTNVRQDHNKRVFLEKHGWIVVDIWESELYWNKPLVYNKLRAVGITEARLDYTQEMGVQFPHCPPIDWSDDLRRLWFKADRPPRKKLEYTVAVCPCGKEFKYKRHGGRQRRYCSHRCHAVYSRKINISPEEMLSVLRENPSYTAVGKRLGAAPNSIKKYCKRSGIFDEVDALIRSKRLRRWEHARRKNQN